MERSKLRRGWCEDTRRTRKRLDSLGVATIRKLEEDEQAALWVKNKMTKGA